MLSILTTQLLVVCLWSPLKFCSWRFLDRPILKTLDILVCQTSEKKAFFTKRNILSSVTVVHEKREHDLISSQFPRFSLGAPSTSTTVWSTCFIPLFACVSDGKKWKFAFGESTGKLGLKVTDRTHTDERKMVQLCYVVPGCVISVLNWYLSIGVR